MKSYSPDANRMLSLPCPFQLANLKPSLSELLHLNMPELKPSVSQQQVTIGLSSNTGSHNSSLEASYSALGPWEDEEERKFYEDIADLAEFVPKAVLGVYGCTRRGSRASRNGRS